MTQSEIQELLNEQYTERLNLQNYLHDTDYIAAKIAEGKATKTEYQDKIAQRQAWRDGINACNARIEELLAIVPEDEEERPIAQ